jgi:predicted lactoylglutathione lyase
MTAENKLSLTNLEKKKNFFFALKGDLNRRLSDKLKLAV